MILPALSSVASSAFLLLSSKQPAQGVTIRYHQPSINKTLQANTMEVFLPSRPSLSDMSMSSWQLAEPAYLKDVKYPSPSSWKCKLKLFLDSISPQQEWLSWKQMTTKSGKNGEKRFPYSLLMRIHWYGCYTEICMEVSHKLNVELPAMWLLGIHPEDSIP